MDMSFILNKISQVNLIEYWVSDVGVPRDRKFIEFVIASEVKILIFVVHSLNIILDQISAPRLSLSPFSPPKFKNWSIPC